VYQKNDENGPEACCILQGTGPPRAFVERGAKYPPFHSVKFPFGGPLKPEAWDKLPLCPPPPPPLGGPGSENEYYIDKSLTDGRKSLNLSTHCNGPTAPELFILLCLTADDFNRK
jgi:hypothetical protein